jgi:hypothetical protein
VSPRRFFQLVGSFFPPGPVASGREVEFGRSLMQVSIITSPEMNICSENGGSKIDISTSALTRQMGNDAMLICCEKVVSKD